MDITALKALIAQGETDRLEFKTSTAQLKGVAETLCGFANHDGGIVVVGVSNSGKILGQHVTDQTRLEIANMLKKFEPPLHVEVEYISLPDTDKEIILFDERISKANIPHSYAGRAFHRVESSTSLMPQAKYQKLLLDKMQNNFCWENLPAKDISLNMLDADEILKTIRVSVEKGRLLESAISSSPKEALLKLGLIENGQLLNAAVVLFSEKFEPYYPQCQLRLAKFKGNNKKEFIDEKRIIGNAFKLLDEAMLFINRHIPTAARILPNQLERAETPLYPTRAVREAIINAICHRDYSIVGGAISIAIYDDRMEIWNDGLLPSGITLTELKHPHPSKPRNPLIAGVFYRRGLIEQWGRGTQNITEDCLESSLPEPEFLEQSHSFCARFLSKVLESQPSLTNRQLEILDIIKSAKEGLSRGEIIEHMKTPPPSSTLRDELYRLQSFKLIEIQGHGRGATWRLKNKTDNKTE